jgi:hypothetical protein
METHRVAVIVFCEVACEGQADADSVAQVAVRRALEHGAGSDGHMPAMPAELAVRVYGKPWKVRALRCMEAGVAIGNGYLWTAPTSKAFRGL